MKRKILAVDDEPANLYLLKNLLTDYDVTTAGNGEELWDCIGSCDPALIILDVMLPGRDGFQLATEIAAHERFGSVPIIFLTACTDPSNVVTGFELGGIDYIKKPFDENELLARIKSVLKKSEEIERLERDVIIDAQTGLYNRRYLSEFIKRESSKMKRGLSRFSLAMIDIDFFKRINDTYGHQCGDYTLREFSQVMIDSIRGYDIAVRYGGEEFIIILPSIDRAEASVSIGRIRKNNSIHDYIHDGVRFSFNFTSGIADFSDLDRLNLQFDDLVKAADRRLYYGKENGRDRIIISD
jgi:two-component system, cell cycle response regulator